MKHFILPGLSLMMLAMLTVRRQQWLVFQWLGILLQDGRSYEPLTTEHNGKAFRS